MTATILENDTDLTLFESLDHETACDNIMRGKDCDNPAKYHCRLACCGRLFLLCEDCMLEAKEYLRDAEKRGVYLTCEHCATREPAHVGWVIVIGML